MKYFTYCRKSSEDENRQVQSIDDQQKVLEILANTRGITDHNLLRESASAKAPGRPVFQKMVEEIGRLGTAGIICWKLDRLARNPVDGGTILWMLQQGIISHIITPEREYRSGDNVLMMSVEFGMANQFILDLRQNTKRGMRSKCEKGWFPGVAPLGYLNNKYCEKGEKFIFKDPDRFDLVRRVWELMLSGKYSVPQVHKIASDEWGLRTPSRRKSGGKVISRSGLYALFNNPFYYGDFDFAGETFRGAHESMISLSEFNRVQALLGEHGIRRAKSKVFAFSGLLRCGECGCAVTAEQKVKRLRKSGEAKIYTYYHCTKKRKGYRCSQRSVEESALEPQLAAWLGSMSFNEKVLAWTIKYLHLVHKDEAGLREASLTVLQKDLESVTRRLDNLLRLKISVENVQGELLSDEEFKFQKQILKEEQRILMGRIADLNVKQDQWIELAETTFDFACHAKEWFEQTDDLSRKKDILLALGSNFVLKDGQALPEAKPHVRPIIEGLAEVRQELERFEPALSRIAEPKIVDFEAAFSKWLPRLDSNQRPSD